MRMRKAWYDSAQLAQHWFIQCIQLNAAIGKKGTLTKTEG